MSDSHSPWWHDRLNVLDDVADRYEAPEDDPNFVAVLDVDEPRIDCGTFDEERLPP